MFCHQILDTATYGGTQEQINLPKKDLSSNSWMEAAHMQNPKLLSKQRWLENGRATTPTAIHGMTRCQQTIIFRLRTGHNRLRQHMYKRFKVGDSEICPCGQAPQNTEHVLQTCSSHKQLRARTWPNHTPLEKKLYATTEELALTVDYIVASGLTV